MAKGIKKFDQEIRVVSSILSMNNISSGFTGALSSNSANTNGAYYVYADTPWFANETTTYQLANNADIQAVSSQTWINDNDITNLSSQTWQNVSDISELSGGSFKFTNGDHTEEIGFDGTLTISGGTDITVVWDGTKYVINNVAEASANYYLTGTSIANGVATFEVKDYGNVTLDLKEQLTLDNLSGVTISGAEDGDFLIYDAPTNTWYASGITEDSLHAGVGIHFDTGTVGQVTIENILAGSGGTWIASDGTTDHNVLYTEKISFLSSGDTTVTYDDATSAFTFYSQASTFDYAWIFNGTTINSGDTVTVDAGTGLVTGGTSTALTLGLNTTIQNNIDASLSAVSFTSTNDDEHFTYTRVDGSTFDVSVDGTWVRKDGDSMVGDYFVQGNLTVTGDTLLVGNLYVSGTTVTVDTENLTVADNIIEINANQTGSAGVTNRTSGLIVNRGELSAYTFAFYEDAVGPGTETQVFRIGETISDASGNTIDMSQTQIVATRADSNSMSDNDLMFWNESESRLDPIDGTTTPTQNDIALFSGGSWTYYNASALVGGTKSWATIWDGTTSATTAQANQTLTILGGDLLSTTLVGSDNPTLTLNHNSVSQTLTAASTSSITFISSISFDGFGHVTGLTTESIDFSNYYTTSETDANFLSANTAYFETISADSTSYTATTPAETVSILGGSGITTSIDASGNLTINSDSSELQYSKTMGGTTTTLTEPDFTGAKVVIIDYLIDGASKQEGQIRFLVSDDTIVHDYQGSLDLSFSDASISGADLVLTHDSNTDTFEYFVKIIS